jgi:TonB family protein
MLIAVWMLALASPGDIVTVADALERLPAEEEPVGSPGRPAGNPGQWVTNDDYPASAMRQEHEGTSGFRLTYDATGRTTGCEITSSSGFAELDAATCRLLVERARFVPGRDAKGAQVGGTYSNRIRWQIPEAGGEWADKSGLGFPEIMASWPRSAFPDAATMAIDPADHYPAEALAKREEGVVRMALDIDAAGKVTGCTVTGSSSSEALDTAACDLMRSEGKFKPALDSAGKPTGAKYATDFRWTLPPPALGSDEAKLVEALDALPGRVRKFPMSDPGSATMSILIAADGSVGDCTFNATGQMMEPGGMSLCDVFGKQRYEPFVDAGGKPVARRIIFRTDLSVEDVPAGKAKP